MTLPFWPDKLPCINASSFQYQLGDPRRITMTDQSLPRVGLNRTKRADTASLTITCTLQQREVFHTFYTDEVRNGTKPFWMNDPILHGTPILLESGLPLLDENGQKVRVVAHWLCLFGQNTPQYSIEKQSWHKIAFSITRLPS